jgi:hypothetical protein
MRRATADFDMRWSTSLLTIVLLAAPPALSAQTVGGRVIDDATAAAVVHADIALLDDGGAVVDSTLTATDGSFSLQAPEAGEYTIRTAHIAYATAVSPRLSLQRGVTLEVEFRVAPRVVPLAPLTVVSRRRETTVRDPRLERRGYYRRKAAYGKEGNGLGFAYFLEGEDIRPTAFAVTDVLRGLSGIHVGAAGGRDVVVTGRHGCPVGFYLDGVPVRSSLDAMMLPTAVVAVEVYTGGVMPAQFHGSLLSFNCGAVVVWTGSRDQR